MPERDRSVRVYLSSVKTASQARLEVEDAVIDGEVEVAIAYGKSNGLAVYLKLPQVEELVTQLSKLLAQWPKGKANA